MTVSIKACDCVGGSITHDTPIGGGVDIGEIYCKFARSWENRPALRNFVGM